MGQLGFDFVNNMKSATGDKTRVSTTEKENKSFWLSVNKVIFLRLGFDISGRK